MTVEEVRNAPTVEEMIAKSRAKYRKHTEAPKKEFEYILDWEDMREDGGNVLYCATDDNFVYTIERNVNTANDKFICSADNYKKAQKRGYILRIRSTFMSKYNTVSNCGHVINHDIKLSSPVVDTIKICNDSANAFAAQHVGKHYVNYLTSGKFFRFLEAWEIQEMGQEALSTMKANGTI